MSHWERSNSTAGGWVLVNDCSGCGRTVCICPQSPPPLHPEIDVERTKYQHVEPHQEWGKDVSGTPYDTPSKDATNYHNE